jgi:hypothetical protein
MRNYQMIQLRYTVASALLVSTPALAAYAPPEPITATDTIVVTGQKPEKKVIRQQASDFIRTVIKLPDDGQYARRNAPICPKVFGVDAQYAQIVEKRIRDIAEAVEAPIAKSSCKLNLVVRFSADGDGYINKLKTAKPGLFATIPLPERKSFFAGTGPVRWWYNLHFTGSDGRDLVSSSPVELPIGPLLSSKGFARNLNSSIVDTNLIVKIEASSVIIDVNKVTGFPLDTIASYAAMVSLGHIRQDADYTGSPSILGIFSSVQDIAEAPRDLTEWDYAYLCALYKIPLNRVARTQRSKIATTMAKDLAGENTEGSHPK